MLESFLKMVILSVHTLEYPGESAVAHTAAAATAASPRTDRRKLLEAQYTAGGVGGAHRVFERTDSPQVHRHRKPHKTYTWSAGSALSSSTPPISSSSPSPLSAMDAVSTQPSSSSSSSPSPAAAAAMRGGGDARLSAVGAALNSSDFRR